MRWIGVMLVVAAAGPATAATRGFQEGVGGWSGTFDRIVAVDGTTVDGAGVASYFLDGDPGEPLDDNDRNLLLRFDGIFGPGAGQVPADAAILGATLVLRTGDTSPDSSPSTGPYVIGRLVRAVDGTTLYTDLGDPGLPGARGAVARPVAAGFVDQKQTEILRADLTAIVREWQAGEPNHGIAIYSSHTTDSWEVASSGHPDPRHRPRLEVEFTTDPVVRRSFIASRSALLDSPAGQPTLDGSSEDAAVIDAEPGSIRELLLAFDDLFGELPGQVAGDQTILKADLVMTTRQQAEVADPSADSFDVFGVFPLTVPWSLKDGDLDGFPDLDFGPAGPTKAAGELADVVAEFAGVGEDSQARTDLTELVKAWRGGLPNHGVDVRMTSAGADGWVVSAPGSAGPFAPFLEITTTTVAPEPVPGVVELRQGVDGYDGTFQMRVDLGDGRRMPSAFASYVLEGDPPAEDASDLLRFDGLVGDGRVPSGATVLSATLEYSTAGSSVSSGSEGPYAVAALTAAVGPETLYSAISGGVGLEGVRGIAGRKVAGFARTATGERVGAEVAAIVQDWADGAPNHGFGVFASPSGDGWEVATTGDVVARRPSLRVEFTTRPTGRLLRPAGTVAILNAGDVTEDGSLAAFAKTDGDPEVRILLGFDGLIGTEAGQLDPAAEVLRAWLVADTGPEPGDSCIGPVAVEAMAVDWSLSSFFSDFGGNGPDAADGETAGVAGRLGGIGIDCECRFDVTAVVRAWQDGSLANEGLMLRAETDDSWWMHMPGGGASREPRLVIVTALPSGFAEYVAGLGLPGLSGGSDDDRDGIPALAEYGLGLHPGVFDPHPGLRPEGAGYRLEWTKGEAAKADPVIGYAIEWSPNLVDWQQPEGVEETADAIGLAVTPAGAGFYRLAVTEG